MNPPVFCCGSFLFQDSSSGILFSLTSIQFRYVIDILCSYYKLIVFILSQIFSKKKEKKELHFFLVIIYIEFLLRILRIIYVCYIFYDDHIIKPKGIGLFFSLRSNPVRGLLFLLIRYGNRIHRPILFFILVLDLMDLIQCIELRETLTYYNPRVLSPPNLRILSLYYLDLQPISPKKKEAGYEIRARSLKRKI